MLEEKKEIENIEDINTIEEEPLDIENEALLIVEKPKHEISLKSSSDEILSKLEDASSVEELKELTKLFQLSLAKKEATRALTQSNLLDLVLEQAGERIQKRPDELSNKDLLDYMNALQSSLDKATKSFDTNISEAPALTLNQTNQEININVNTSDNVISEESREKILNFINAVKNSSLSNKSIQEVSDEVKVIDATKENKND